MQRASYGSAVRRPTSAFWPSLVCYVAAIALLLVILGGCTSGRYYGGSDNPAMVPPPGSTLVIEHSPGGKVYASMMAFIRMEREGTKVRVEGTCASSCTLLLTRRNMCYTPDAVFVFHGASRGGVYDPVVSRAMANAYPPLISKWTHEHDALADPNRYVAITGAEIAKIDNQKRICQ